MQTQSTSGALANTDTLADANAAVAVDRDFLKEVEEAAGILDATKTRFFAVSEHEYAADALRHLADVLVGFQPGGDRGTGAASLIMAIVCVKAAKPHWEVDITETGYRPAFMRVVHVLEDVLPVLAQHPMGSGAEQARELLMQACEKAKALKKYQSVAGTNPQ